MQLLYVVDFDVDGSRANTGEPEVETTFDIALQCVAEWIGRTASDTVSIDDLQANGSVALRPSRPHYTRAASWHVLGSGASRTVRLEMSDKDHETEGEFLTRVTFGPLEGQLKLRVSMARVFPTDWLSPIPPADLRQPGVIDNLMRSDRIDLRIKKQRQDGRYIQIRSAAEVDALIEALLGNERLPILIIHTRTLPALNTARTAATKLVGLVRVVTVDYSALSYLARTLPSCAPPYAGARLIWSDISAPAVAFDAREVNGTDADWLRAQLMNKLAPISVLSRGVDHTYRRARQAQLAARSNEIEARSAAAAATGDLSAQVIMLKERILELQSDVQDWQAMAFEAEAEANQVKAQAERVPTLEEQVNQLGIALRASHDEHGGTTQSVDPWTILPSLESGSKDSAQVLFLRLQELTSERIVFTERALTSWKKARYPHPEEMLDALGKLSQVAIALYDGTERVMTHLDKWIREEFDLKVALQDDTIQKNKSLWKFIYEDRSHDRTPHVKVRDHAPHQEVGRIHFALDSENTRIIVDHVGVKLY